MVPFSAVQTPDLAASVLLNGRLASLYVERSQYFPASLEAWIPGSIRGEVVGKLPAVISSAKIRPGMKVQLFVSDESQDLYVHPKYTYDTLGKIIPARQLDPHYKGMGGHSLEHGPAWLARQVNDSVVDFLNKL